MRKAGVKRNNASFQRKSNERKKAAGGKAMQSYATMDKEQQKKEKESLLSAYKEYQKRDLSLNMARGKPSSRQLDLSRGLLDTVNSGSDFIEDGMDVRNYGGLEGLSGAKKILAEMVGADPAHVIVCGNSSLNIMYDTISRAMVTGICGSTPWDKLDTVRFLCPVPGYDRHFGVTEHFGIEMINVPMTSEGPDMDLVEKLVSEDPSIKGIWCVPKYSNPEGVVYSDETVRRMASLHPAAEDFRVFWDNAYCVHDLYEEIVLPDIFAEAEKAGNEDMIFEFVSTSKISFAGAGIAGIIASGRNLADMKKSMSAQTIGYDKINQLRHIRFFHDGAGIRAQMKKHAEILRPKFEAVDKILTENLAGTGTGCWTKPRGGYFVTFYTMDGCAARTVALAKECGLTMTGAGAPFPYHKDPTDSAIRIAPSLPPLDELKDAMQIFCICVKIAALEKLLGE